MLFCVIQNNNRRDRYFLLLVESQLELSYYLISDSRYFFLLVNYNWNSDWNQNLTGSVLLPSPCQLQLEPRLELESTRECPSSISLLNHSWNSDEHGGIYLPSPCQLQLEPRLELESNRKCPSSISLSTTIGNSDEHESIYLPSPCQLQLELESNREYPSSISLLNHSWNPDWNQNLLESVLLPSPC